MKNSATAHQARVSHLMTRSERGLFINDTSTVYQVLILLMAFSFSTWLVVDWKTCPLIMKIILILAVLVCVCAPRCRTLCFDIASRTVTEDRKYWLGIERTRRWKFDDIVKVTTSAMGSDSARRRYQMEILTVTERIPISTTLYTYSRDDKKFCRNVVTTIQEVLDEGCNSESSPVQLEGEVQGES